MRGYDRPCYQGFLALSRGLDFNPGWCTRPQRPKVGPSGYDHTVRAGDLTLPFRFGWGGFRRSLQTDTMLAHLRQRIAPDQHWYLMALGVAPSKQGHGLGTALLQPILSRANTENLPCYLETFTERMVRFYAKHGFTVVAEERLPNAGPVFWAMVREPQTLRG